MKDVQNTTPQPVFTFPHEEAANVLAEEDDDDDGGTESEDSELEGGVVKITRTIQGRLPELLLFSSMCVFHSFMYIFSSGQ
jgi:hypothetical protein